MIEDSVYYWDLTISTQGHSLTLHAIKSRCQEPHHGPRFEIAIITPIVSFSDDDFLTQNCLLWTSSLGGVRRGYKFKSRVYVSNGTHSSHLNSNTFENAECSFLRCGIFPGYYSYSSYFKRSPLWEKFFVPIYFSIFCILNAPGVRVQTRISWAPAGANKVFSLININLWHSITIKVRPKTRLEMEALVISASCIYLLCYQPNQLLRSNKGSYLICHTNIRWNAPYRDDF